MTRDEFEYLLNQYETDIYSLCRRLCRNKDEADELFQDTWLSAMEQIGDININNNPKSYLIGKTIYLWKSGKRKYARRQRIAPIVDASKELEDICFVSDSGTPEELVINQEIARCLIQEVSLLKEKYRIVIELYYSLNLSAKEIANILHIPQGTVESRLYKARKLLKTKMEGHGYEF